MKSVRILAVLLATPALAQAPAAQAPAQAPAAQAQAEQPAPGVAAPLPASLKAREAVLTAQVLLDRASFSPGVIDGRAGANMNGALRAWAAANDVRFTGRLTPALLEALRQADSGAILERRAISEADASGPFSPQVPAGDLAAMAEQKAVGYRSARERLAERFHMDETLLQALNPDVDFSKPGQEITVAAVSRKALPQVARVTVMKGAERVQAYDAAGKIVASFPATIGSGELPSPTGSMTVRAVAPEASYTFDPERLNFGDKSQGKVVVPAGPNNPVGGVWIDLSKDTYGIHGAPDPALIGKRSSSGCVRLTNWDARQLAAAVKAGTAVEFVS